MVRAQVCLGFQGQYLLVNSNFAVESGSLTRDSVVSYVESGLIFGITQSFGFCRFDPGSLGYSWAELRSGLGTRTSVQLCHASFMSCPFSHVVMTCLRHGSANARRVISEHALQMDADGQYVHTRRGDRLMSRVCLLHYLKGSSFCIFPATVTHLFPFSIFPLNIQDLPRYGCCLYVLHQEKYTPERERERERLTRGVFDIVFVQCFAKALRYFYSPM